jgi:hypothetical protein
VEDYASHLFIDSTQTSFRTEVVLAESANDWTARFRGGCGTLTYSCVPLRGKLDKQRQETIAVARGGRVV